MAQARAEADQRVAAAAAERDAAVAQARADAGQRVRAADADRDQARQAAAARRGHGPAGGWRPHAQAAARAAQAEPERVRADADQRCSSATRGITG